VGLEELALDCTVMKNSAGEQASGSETIKKIAALEKSRSCKCVLRKFRRVFQI